MHLNEDNIIQFRSAVSAFRKKIIQEEIKKILFGKKSRSSIEWIKKGLDKKMEHTQKLFKRINEDFSLNDNILIIDYDSDQLLARFIDIYQTRFSKGTVTVYNSKLDFNKLGNINLVKKDICYGVDDVRNFDVILARNPREQLEDVIALALENNLSFFVETTYPWVLERFESAKYDVYDEDNYEIILGILHDYMREFCEDVEYYSSDNFDDKTYFVRKKKKINN